jgi:hypothetical protein
MNLAAIGNDCQFGAETGVTNMVFVAVNRAFILKKAY